MTIVYIQLYGIRVGVNLQIDLDALANDLGAKAAGNASGKATARFGRIKASFNATDLQALTAANGARQAARKQRWQPECDPIDGGDNLGESPDC